MFEVINRETGESIETWENVKRLSLEGSREVAANYIKDNPDATLLITELHDRVWKCSSTGNIRSDKVSDLSGRANGD